MGTPEVKLPQNPKISGPSARNLLCLLNFRVRTVSVGFPTSATHGRRPMPSNAVGFGQQNKVSSKAYDKNGRFPPFRYKTRTLAHNLKVLALQLRFLFELCALDVGEASLGLMGSAPE